MPNDGQPGPTRRRRLAVVGFVIVLIAGGAVLWHKRLREEFVPKNFGQVETDRIYRSGQLTERMLRKVCDEHGIKTVIALNKAKGQHPDYQLERKVAGEIGVDHYGFTMAGDGRGDPADYAEVVRLMADPERQPVLVHCQAGAQRTTVAVLLYEAIVKGRDVSETYSESFDYKHAPSDWKALAYVADHLDEIRARYESAPPAE